MVGSEVLLNIKIIWIFKLLCGISVYCKGVDFMSILQELWYGNINPSEDRHISDEEKELVELMARHQEYLTSKLKEKELDAFKKYVECVDEYTSWLNVMHLKLDLS